MDVVPGSPYADLRRPPLEEAALRRALVVPGGLWTSLRVVRETGSTNADLAARARVAGPRGPQAEGEVLIAERQTAGRGRLGRVWEAPAQAGLTLSVLLRPAGVEPTRLGWLPLLAGVALAEAVARLGEVDAVLKWPNDLLVRAADGTGGYGKCAGLLAEAVPSPAGLMVVLGLGLNVTQRADELPPVHRVDPTAPPATSLALVGAACTDRDPLLRATLRALADRYLRWRAAAGDPRVSGVADAYRERCATLGGQVRVQLPDGATLEGHASDVDDEGRLVVRAAAGGIHHVAAGDIGHLR
jgi:BirA family biotin operon repressor/biotin-[acetyl-CoA-carboxylase] ligase